MSDVMQSIECFLSLPWPPLWVVVLFSVIPLAVGLTFRRLMRRFAHTPSRWFWWSLSGGFLSLVVQALALRLCHYDVFAALVVLPLGPVLYTSIVPPTNRGQ